MDYTPPPQFGTPAGGPQPPSMGKPEKSRKDKGEKKQVTKRAVDKQMKIAAVFAVIVAVVGGLILFGSTAPKSYVVVAKSPLAAGTAVDPQAQLVAVPQAKENILAGAFQGTSPEAAMALAKEEISGQRLQYPVAAKQQVGRDQFGVEISLADPLKPQERLVSISATVAQAVAGTIKAGDTVDVVASTKDVSGLVLSNVPVVSVTVSENQYQAVAEQQTGDAKDAKPEALLPSTPVPGIYVVRVSADDAARLVSVDAGAELALVYRPKGDTSTTAGKPMTALGVICEANPSADGCATR